MFWRKKTINKHRVFQLGLPESIQQLNAFLDETNGWIYQSWRREEINALVKNNLIHVVYEIKE